MSRTYTFSVVLLLVAIGVLLFAYSAKAQTYIINQDSTSDVFDTSASGDVLQEFPEVLLSGSPAYIKFYAQLDVQGSISGSPSFAIHLLQNSAPFQDCTIYQGVYNSSNSDLADAWVALVSGSIESFIIDASAPVPGTGFGSCSSVSLVESSSWEVRITLSGFTTSGNDISFLTYTDSSDVPFLQITSDVPPPSPATTEFNEVLNYIPSAGVSTTTGTTTVGASFSIANPTFIEYFGYRLISPNGTVLYDASTTPSSASIYEISTDYNFTDTGIYQGHAYFAQDFGGVVWEVDNQVVQQILIDLDEWTVLPDGSFSGDSSTTSTSTLSTATLECGTDFAGSICNFVANLFIPNAASVQNFFSSISLFLERPPLSFFYELNNAFRAFGAPASVSAASLSVSLFGISIPVVSTSTAASVGLSGNTLATARALMGYGIMILGLWYIFWRAQGYAEKLLGISKT